MAIQKKRILIIAVALIVVAALAFVITWSWVFRKAETSVAGQKSAIIITAPALLKAFESNEDSANVKYLGKVLSVAGTIAEVKESSDNVSIYLKEKDAVSGVMCSFNKGAVQKETFQTGNTLKLKGICTGYLMDVLLNKCAIEN